MSMSENFIQEQLSWAYVRAVIYRAGFNLAIPEVDDHGIDGTISSYSKGMNRVDFQLKSTFNYEIRGQHVLYDLDADNYNVLVQDFGAPAVLILFVMPEDRVRWLEQSEQELRLRHCAYWMSLEGDQRTDNVSSKRVGLPKSNMFTVAGLPCMFRSVIPNWQQQRSR